MQVSYTGSEPFVVGSIRVYLNPNPNGPGHYIKIEQNNGDDTYSVRVSMIVMDTIISPGLVLYKFVKGTMSIYTIGNVRYDLMRTDTMLQSWIKDHEQTYSLTPASFQNSPEYTTMILKAEQDKLLAAPDSYTKEEVIFATIDSTPKTSMETTTNNIETIVTGNPQVVVAATDGAVKKSNYVPYAVGAGLLLLLLL
jgi:hypothetical protein